jgi:hypothetical protein
VAVALQTTFVSFAGGYRHRSAGLQVVLADHDDGDRERVVVVGGVVDAAVSVRFLYRMTLLFAATLLPDVAYQVLSSVGIWRSADNYRGRSVSMGVRHICSRV